MADWEENLARDIKRDRENKQRGDDKFNNEQAFYKAHAPVFWRKLKEIFSEKVYKLTVAMGGEEVATLKDHGDSLIISAKQGDGMAHIAFDSRTYVIDSTVSRPGKASTQAIYLAQIINGQLVYKKENDTDGTNPMQIAEKTLSILLRSYS